MFPAVLVLEYPLLQPWFHATEPRGASGVLQHPADPGLALCGCGMLTSPAAQDMPAVLFGEPALAVSRYHPSKVPL